MSQLPIDEEFAKLVDRSVACRSCGQSRSGRMGRHIDQGLGDFHTIAGQRDEQRFAQSKDLVAAAPVAYDPDLLGEVCDKIVDLLGK